MKKIFIDPGHGGRDPGAVREGLTEKEIVLDIALTLREYFLRYSTAFSVLLSREYNHTYKTNSQKVKMANEWGADLVIAIHCNASTNDNARGTLCVCAPGSRNGRRLSELILNEYKRIPILSKLPSRGVYTDSELGRGKNFKLIILRETKAPAVLVETAFLSNEHDRKILKMTAGKNAFARGIFNAVCVYYNMNHLRGEHDKAN